MQLSFGRVLAGVEWADQQDKLTESGGLQSHPVWPFRTFDRSLTDLRGRVTSHGKMWVLVNRRGQIAPLSPLSSVPYCLRPEFGRLGQSRPDVGFPQCRGVSHQPLQICSRQDLQ